jgi:uncharacterized protein YgfB (UPF0149 family)
MAVNIEPPLEPVNQTRASATVDGLGRRPYASRVATAVLRYEEQSAASFMFSIGYEEFERVLSDSGSFTAAGEAHGTLCGALCAMAAYRIEDWVGELLPENRNPDDGIDPLFELVYTETYQAISGQGMEFAPLLPDDDAPIAARATALGEWCQGFLYGLGAGRIASAQELPDDLREIVRDLTEVSRASADEKDSLETNEQAYAELMEFVRVSAQLVFDELAPLRQDVLSRLEALH